MGSIWTVAPESDRLDLKFVDDAGDTQAFWIRVKRRLNVGEERRVQTAGWRGASIATKDAESALLVDWKLQSLARAEVYLIDWSLADDQGAKLALTRDVIEALHPGVFLAIENGITAHLEARDAAKKTRAGGAEPSATSA